jgi:septation ring formation regulator EzrA
VNTPAEHEKGRNTHGQVAQKTGLKAPTIPGLPAWEARLDQTGHNLANTPNSVLLQKQLARDTASAQYNAAEEEIERTRKWARRQIEQNTRIAMQEVPELCRLYSKAQVTKLNWTAKRAYHKLRNIIDDERNGWGERGEQIPRAMEDARNSLLNHVKPTDEISRHVRDTAPTITVLQTVENIISGTGNSLLTLGTSISGLCEEVAGNPQQLPEAGVQELVAELEELAQQTQATAERARRVGKSIRTITNPS